jgi:hypothetical protein
MGTWKKLAGAFIDFEDSEDEPVSNAGSNLDSTEDVDALLESLNVATAAVSVGTATESVGVVVSIPAPALIADKPFSEIYSDQNVPASPKSAEEVLAILVGMATLPPEVRKISIDAMDTADDSWTMDDVLLDAKNKQGALLAYKTGLDVSLSQAKATMEADLTTTDEYVTGATETIRDQIESLQAQIAECQTLLQDELVGATEQKANIRSGYDAVMSTHVSECSRIDTEIKRLQTV